MDMWNRLVSLRDSTEFLEAGGTFSTDFVQWFLKEHNKHCIMMAIKWNSNNLHSDIIHHIIWKHIQFFFSRMFTFCVTLVIFWLFLSSQVQHTAIVFLQWDLQGVRFVLFKDFVKFLQCCCRSSTCPAGAFGMQLVLRAVAIRVSLCQQLNRHFLFDERFSQLCAKKSSGAF